MRTRKASWPHCAANSSVKGTHSILKNYFVINTLITGSNVWDTRYNLWVCRQLPTSIADDQWPQRDRDRGQLNVRLFIIYAILFQLTYCDLRRRNAACVGVFWRGREGFFPPCHVASIVSTQRGGVLTSPRWSLFRRDEEGATLLIMLRPSLSTWQGPCHVEAFLTWREEVDPFSSYWSLCLNAARRGWPLFVTLEPFLRHPSPPP